MAKKRKTTVGRHEEVGFPDLKIDRVSAKIDTGAYSTALHCYDVYEMREGDVKILCFRVLDPSHPGYSNEEMQVRKFWRRKIKSSSGESEIRYVIKTSVSIGGREIKTEVSLTDRGSMKFPVLIGRRLLSRGFLVDVSKTRMLNQKQSI